MTCRHPRKKTAAGPMGGLGPTAVGSAETENPLGCVATRCAACKENSSRRSAEEAERISRLGPDAHFEMQVRAGCLARPSDTGDLVAARDPFAFRNEVLRVVGVDRHQIPVVGEQDELPVAPPLAGEE